MHWEIQKGEVTTNNFGLSNEEKEAQMYIYDYLDERNSLHFNKEHKFNCDVLHKENVNLTTLDNYVSGNNIPKIELLKIDVEGHETNVIDGATNLIKAGRINCIHFEYNNNWAAAGFKLEDIFDKLSNYGYKFYRLAIWGKIPVKHYNKKLENYKHANYVAILIN